MTGPLIFTDLDDTLFQTRRKCPPDMGAEQLMSTLVDGSPSGYASERQVRFAHWLSYGTVVPVTARSRNVLARVAIAQAPAICANGGCILTERGEIDQTWHESLGRMAAEHPAVSEIHAQIGAELAPETFRHWVAEETGLGMYLVIKANGEDDGPLDRAEEVVIRHRPDGWRIHRNSNNLALLPPWLNKRHAVAHLLGRARESDPYLPAIGIGDSHSDVGFMDLCDFAVTPTTSQVWHVLKKDNGWCE